jgi:hypothetical protein
LTPDWRWCWGPFAGVGNWRTINVTADLSRFGFWWFDLTDWLERGHWVGTGGRTGNYNGVCCNPCNWDGIYWMPTMVDNP